MGTPLFSKWEKKMGAKVTLEVKSVTGRVRYYSVGENAKHVLTLIKKKTLSELEVEALKALGCEIERIPKD
jgi:hypothetical protein